MRVRYCVGNSGRRITVAVRGRWRAALWVRPKRAEKPSAVTDSIVLERKDRDCCATQLQAGDGLTSVVYDTNQVVVSAVIVRGGRIGVSYRDRPVSVEGDQNGATLIGASILIGEIGIPNTPSNTGIAAGDDGTRLRLGKRSFRSHHQNDDADNK